MAAPFLFDKRMLIGGSDVRSPRNGTEEGARLERHSRPNHFCASGEFPHNRSKGRMTWSPFERLSASERSDGLAMVQHPLTFRPPVVPCGIRPTEQPHPPQPRASYTG